VVATLISLHSLFLPPLSLSLRPPLWWKICPPAEVPVAARARQRCACLAEMCPPLPAARARACLAAATISHTAPGIGGARPAVDPAQGPGRLGERRGSLPPRWQRGLHHHCGHARISCTTWGSHSGGAGSTTVAFLPLSTMMTCAGSPDPAKKRAPRSSGRDGSRLDWARRRV
jgi:hypothetical protein